MKMIFKQFIIIALLTVVGLLAYSSTPALAQADLWGDQLTTENLGIQELEETGLGNEDPRAIVINIIRVILGLLGIIAVVLLMYGGYIWMTAGGDIEKVAKAQTLIRNAVIGLFIILASFAIVSFILSRLTNATGAGSGDSNQCITGEAEQCKAGDCWRTCSGGSWGPCLGADCGISGGGDDIACDTNTFLPGCQADNVFCSAYNKYCDVVSCKCVSQGGYGEFCGTGADEAECNKNSDQCAANLSCGYDAVDNRCECSGPPTIEGVTPMGGFCVDDNDIYCVAKSDCPSGACDLKTPNGAVGNLITIHGNNFLNYDSATSRVLFWDGSDYTIEASLASTVNSDCDGSWVNDQIIVVVPTGASVGGIKIEAVNGSDATNVSPGPTIPDFVINNVKRPGLCKLDPVSGVIDTVINYHGIKLAGVTAYFGSLTKNVRASNSSFADNLKGTALVSNISSGRVTTFVQGSPSSNYLYFIKEVEAPDAPMVVSIDPAIGTEGQYVTIVGQGFGAVQGNSTVYFDTEEADFSFPSICINDIWRNEQIIVKVPGGLTDKQLYDVIVEVDNQTAISPTQFKYDEDYVLSPGLCSVYPVFGQHNEEIELWGEYFDKFDNDSKVRYYLNQDQTQTEITYWGVDKSVIGARPDKVVTTIHQQAVTGPVKIVKWDSRSKQELVSNGVNLIIGKCQKDTDCGVGVCCPNGTAEAGRCQQTPDLCFGTTDSSVYEWEFSTGSDVSCPPEKPAQCEDGSCCSSLKGCKDVNNNGVTSCTDDNSCGGYGSKLCVDSIYCPNSPGSCSQNPTAVVTGGTCDCAVLGCLNCTFDNTLNKCVDNVDVCSLATESADIDGNLVQKYCTVYNGSPRWHLATNKTCPIDFPTKLLNGDCVNEASSCDLCASNLTCYDNDGIGVCTSVYPVCANNYQCINSVCTRSEGTCECCCDKGQNNPDDTNPACCSPLICDNFCGSSAVDPNDSDDQWGSCSGCANVGITQADHDNACNCSGTNGKYCDTSVVGGVCRDCSQIGDAKECGVHDTCCVDFQQGNACTSIFSGEFDDLGNPLRRPSVWDNIVNVKYCGYYACDNNCQQPTKKGTFSIVDKCIDDCPIHCDADLATPSCQKDSNMCPTDKPYCSDDCLCTDQGLDMGDECYDAFGTCSLDCVLGYTCLDVDGNSGVGCRNPGSEDSCKCCCDPNLPDVDDECKLVDEALNCQANIGECTGQDRGSCCGCQSDDQCGDKNRFGCGLDTCCSSRPKVEEVYPVIGETDACRNSLVSIKFDQAMNEGTLVGNIIVVGNYGSDLCPAHTELLTDLAYNDVDQNWLEKAWRKIRGWLARLIPTSQVSAASDNNFCVIKGRTTSSTVVRQGKERTIAQFNIDTAFDPGIEYYIIIKGDKGLNSENGVLSSAGVGMNGQNQSIQALSISTFNGITYPRSYIWSFTAGDDICQVDRVEVIPNQHLFQQPFVDYDFEARALSDTEQYIQRIPGVYDWQLDWSVDNVDIATVDYDLALDNFATVTSGNREDASTWLLATATITEDIITPLSTKGREVTGKARIILFFCVNPWPIMTDPDAWPIRWNDRDDNCDICVDPVTGVIKPCTAGSDCLDNKFSLYYCRDNGDESTLDDLPSLSLDPSIRGRYQYDGNYGLVDILKDFLFSREDRPFTLEDSEWLVSNYGSARLGGEVKLGWTGAKGFIYKIYYGQASGKYDNFVVLTEASPYIINGLKNGQTYYFAMTSINDKRVESLFSGEKTLVVSDVTPPEMPVNFTARVNATDSANLKIEGKWDLADTDVAGYIFEYGPYQEPAIRKEVGYNDSYTVRELDNLSIQPYHARIIAVDAAGNESNAVELFCDKGCVMDDDETEKYCDCVL